jgi:hypothetical protein
LLRLEKLRALVVAEGLTTPDEGLTPCPPTMYSKPVLYDSEIIFSFITDFDSVRLCTNPVLKDGTTGIAAAGDANNSSISRSLVIAY